MVLVEGYTDVLAMYQAGIAETVAVMGTALTQEQLGELARAVGQDGSIYLAFDADRSGQEAMLRAARMAEDRDVGLYVVRLPEGDDPADLVAAEGAAGVLDRLAVASSILEFAVGRTLEDEDLQTPVGRDRALVRVRSLIAAAPERSARRDHLVRLVADRLDVPVEYVIAGMERPAARPESFEDPGPEAGAEAPAAVRLDAEGMFLALCAAAGQEGRRFLEKIGDVHLSSAALRRARDHLIAHPGDPLAELSGQDREAAAVLTAVAAQASEADPPDEMRLRTDFLHLDKRRIEREMRHARADGDFGRQGRLAADLQQVRVKLDAAIAEGS
jgi:DNA primase